MSRRAFTPGNKANLRRLLEYQQVVLNKQIIIDGQPIINQIESGGSCCCFLDKVVTKQQSYNDSTQTNNQRISNLLSSNLGGKTTFGNFNIQNNVFFLGGIEGQPGGMPRPLRNKF